MYGLLPPGEILPQALEAARRAMDLGRDLPDAHNALAYAAWMNRDWQTAEAGFLRALELNPKHVQARCWYGIYYLQMATGRMEDGVVEARRALELDPLSAYGTAVYALTLAGAGRPGDGVEQSLLAVERDPASYFASWVLQHNYLLASQFSDSIEAGERALALSGRHPWSLCFQAVAYARWGKASEARAVHNELLARAAQGYVQPSVMMVSAVAIGEIEDAVALAQAGYEERDVFQIVTWHFPTGVDLRAVPRIQAIFDRLNTPES